MKRYITLPNGKPVSLPVYCSAWCTLHTLDPDERISGFDHFPMEAGRVLREIQRGVQDRINRHLPGYGRGRKWSDDWQRAAGHTARRVNTPRLIVCLPEVHPVELRARLTHRIHQPENDA